MFPSQHSNQLLAPDPSILSGDILQIGNLVAGNAGKRSRKSKSGLQDAAPTDEFNLRKLMHRDIERQRRREMSSLYASLRSLLPLEYIRGKRSISDHMQEAVNYIKHMKVSIEELRIRRDKLEKQKKTMANSENGSTNDAVCLRNCVRVNSCGGGGIEILIICKIKEGEGILLSKVFDEMLRRELSVVSCVTTTTENKFLCTIQSEVNELTYIDMGELQRRLANLINAG